MNNTFAKSYRDPKWHSFRTRIFQRDNFTCCHCGIKREPSDLNAHHLRYIKGRKAYDYLDIDLITLCKGCHALEHGTIMPQTDWEYIGEDDLGNIAGECDVCGSQLRYVHEIYHPAWGYIFVGCDCADRLTQSSSASTVEKLRKQKAKRFHTFQLSKKWKHHKNGYFSIYKKFHIKIWFYAPIYIVQVEFSYLNKAGNVVWDVIEGKRKKFSTLEEAQFAAFESIDSGKIQRYINTKYEHYDPENESDY